MGRKILSVLVMAFALAMCGGVSAETTGLYIHSMADVEANAIYDNATRTYYVEATNIYVVGNVILPVDGVTPRNIIFNATNELELESSGTIAAKGGTPYRRYTCGGSGGTISISANAATISGSITANGVEGWIGCGGSGGTISISANAATISGSITANGGPGWRGATGSGGTITLTASDVTISGSIAANAGGWGTTGRPGGIIDISADAVTVSGSITANGGGGLRKGRGGSITIAAPDVNIIGSITANGGGTGGYYSSNPGGLGGTITINSESFVIGGTISANGGIGTHRGPGGKGGTITFNTIYIDVSNGLISANGGYGQGTYASGGIIETNYCIIIPEDEPTTKTHYSAKVDGTITFICTCIEATTDIDPDTLNLKAKGVFTAYITLPEGHSTVDIDAATVECSGASATRTSIEDGVLIAKFNRADLDAETGDEVELTVIGRLDDGTPFKGTDTVRVTEKGKNK